MKNITVRNSTIFVISVCIITIFSISAAKAKPVNKVNAKCHVALINGHEAIVFYHIKAKKFSRLTDNIVGKKVLTQESNKKIKIYRAYECVLATQTFTKPQSRLLDAKTQR